MTELTKFYSFPEFTAGQRKSLVLLQVDIEGHSKLSREKRPADVMAMKIELASELEKRLKAVGYGGVGWQGDGGMFALDVSDSVDLVDKVVPAWRAIGHAIARISERSRPILGDGLIPVRTSAHVCSVLVHPDPRYWHSEGLNSFAKAERALGRRDKFVVTGELYRELPEQAKQEFIDLAEAVTVGERSDIYEYSGVLGDANMALKLHEMERIRLESGTFRATVRRDPKRNASSDVLRDPLLIVVDLQNDFAGSRTLAVAGAVDSAERNATLAQRALSSGYEVVVTRDWHPRDHFSFEKWRPHCVAQEEGAEFIPEFQFERVKDRVLVADIGAANDTPDYSPFYDARLRDFMENRAPREILVSGIALEYCVLATSLSSLAYSPKVVALQDYICTAKADQADHAWNLLSNEGVEIRKGDPFA